MKPLLHWIEILVAALSWVIGLFLLGFCFKTYRRPRGKK